MERQDNGKPTYQRPEEIHGKPSVARLKKVESGTSLSFLFDSIRLREGSPANWDGGPADDEDDYSSSSSDSSNEDELETHDIYDALASSRI